MKHANLVTMFAICACGTQQPATVQAPPPSPRAEAPPAEPPAPACEITADYRVMDATSPPAWLPTEETQGPCEMDHEGRLRKEADAEPYSELDMATGSTPLGPFTVTFTGPHGSGRLWDVGVSYRRVRLS